MRTFLQQCRGWVSTRMLNTLLFVGLLLPLASFAATEQPNIVLIMIDDLGYTDMGAYGSEIDTPNLDALAAQSFKFTDAHALPSCGPTRAALMTGQDQHRVGLGSQNQIYPPGASGDMPGYKGSLEGDYVGLAKILADAGYSTFIAGKWHLGHKPGQLPGDLGFQQSVVLLDALASHYSDQLGPSPHISETGTGKASYMRNDQPIDSLPDDFYSTRFYSDEFIRMVDVAREQDQPFFGFLSYTAMHDPLHAPAELIEKYADRYTKSFIELRKSRIKGMCEQGVLQKCDAATRWAETTPDWETLTDRQKYDLQHRMATYAGMMDYTDQQVGRVFDHLKATGEYDNTLFVVVSDNGASAMPASLYVKAEGEEEWQRENYPHRKVEDYGKRGSFPAMGMPNAQAASGVYYGYKLTVFEGGTRIPMLVKMPGKTDGKVVHALTHISDLYPTFAEFAGADLGNQQYLIGHSMKPLLEGRAKAVRENGEFGMAWMGWRVYRQGDWKLVFMSQGFGGTDGYALYNLKDDPGETTDLLASEQDKVKELAAKWDAYARANNIVDSPMDVVNGVMNRVVTRFTGMDWGE